MSRFNSELNASTMVEVLVTMTLSGILLLAVYDGLDIISDGIGSVDRTDVYGHLDWLEHYESIEFRSDSVQKNGNLYVFYLYEEPVDTLVEYGL